MHAEDSSTAIRFEIGAPVAHPKNDKLNSQRTKRLRRITPRFWKSAATQKVIVDFKMSNNLRGTPNKLTG